MYNYTPQKFDVIYNITICINDYIYTFKMFACFTNSHNIKKNKIVAIQAEQTYQSILNYSNNKDAENTSNHKECWICLQEEGHFHKVCHCNMYVHLECLNKWRNVKQNTDEYYKCRICNSNYIYTQDKYRIPVYYDDEYLGILQINKSSHYHLYDNYMSELSSMMTKYVGDKFKISEYHILLKNILYICDNGKKNFTGIYSFNDAIYQDLQYIKFKPLPTAPPLPKV